jgi:hypothetical protein
MRKLLTALAVLAVVLAVSAPHFTSAASLKVSGIWRFRGISLDNADRNDQGPNDASQTSDALTRPRWTFTSLKGKIIALYELRLRLHVRRCSLHHTEIGGK